ncbi:MAG: hypothetical protein PVG83_13600 [Acidimicrobiia bacterium]
MTYTAQPQTTARLSETGWHVITGILGAIGIVAAAIGAWLEFGPDGGTLTLFSWTWNVADLSTLWAPFLMIGGGLLTSVSMGLESLRDWEAEARTWIVMLEGLVVLIGIAAIAIGIVLLF